SLERAKEVGVRKVVGASRRQLIRQFLFESFVLNILGAGLAVLIMELALSVFSQFSGTPAMFILLEDIRFWIGFLAVFVFGVFLSGLYPAFILSSFQPVSAIKGNTGPASRGVILRKGLVVFQFMVSAALIAGTLTVYKQISHMINSDLGMDIEQTLVLQRPNVIIDKSREEFEARTETFKKELEKISGVGKISRSMYVPGDDVFMINEGQKADESIDATIDIYEIQMDDNFIEMYDLKLLAGRNFSREFRTDSSGIILNDTARKLLGWESPESAINQKFIYQTKNPFTVVGVVADYHQESLKQNFEPLVFLYRPSNNGHYSVKIKTDNPMGIIAAVKELWDKFYPGNPCDYFFLDDHYNRQYGSDWQFLKMFGLFSLLAIFVACLGLLGLSLFNTVQRTKEIGIRKVLGASLSNIIFMLTKDFFKLIILANLIALPLFYFYLNKWLGKYPFRIGIGWWFFTAPLVLIAGITLLVISYHSLKAATSNPVEALRYE
ncbi:MAG: FtsX-like permease family protein, partial [Candidatus Aminicenantaceae bacterium]